jgi:hypothetical protein
MHHVKKARLLPINSPTVRGLQNRGVSSKRHREFTTIDSVSIKTGSNDMFVIAEAPTTQSVEELLGHPMSFSVRSVGTIARVNPW